MNLSPNAGQIIKELAQARTIYVELYIRLDLDECSPIVNGTTTATLGRGRSAHTSGLPCFTHGVPLPLKKLWLVKK